MICCASKSRSDLGDIEMQHLCNVYSTRNTNDTFIAMVRTVKKSVDTVWPMWLCRRPVRALPLRIERYRLDARHRLALLHTKNATPNLVQRSRSDCGQCALLDPEFP